MFGTGINYAPSISGTSGTTGAAASATDTARGPSNNIWKDCDISLFTQSPREGMYFFDDFLVSGNMGSSAGGAIAASLGQWTVYGSQGATVTDAALEGGVLTLASDGDQEGVTLQSSSAAFRLVTTSTLALNGKLWFETSVSRSSVANTKGEFFVGLASTGLSSGLPVAAHIISTTDDTLSTTPSFIGFHCNSSTSVRGGPTEVAFCFELASGTVNYPTNMTTLLASTGQTVLAANTIVKLGFLFDPNPISTKLCTAATARQTAGNLYRPLIRVFVNGLELPTFLASVDVQNATATQAFPTDFMCPTIEHRNTTGSTPATTNVDWIRVAQRANS